jgi:hypothetical protein
LAAAVSSASDGHDDEGAAPVTTAVATAASWRRVAVEQAAPRIADELAVAVVSGIAASSRDR